MEKEPNLVLNLIITGIPSILQLQENILKLFYLVLNLIITGIPSIQPIYFFKNLDSLSFKPYYNWNTFNTLELKEFGLSKYRFKPYYNWNTFNTY